jgi:amino acid adenylation domain-containing protein/non-ribosomal peptide synthase protein (TIGR01720 family)
MRDPAAHRPHLLDIVCSVEGGRLRVSWLYPERLMARDRIEVLAADMLARLRAMIAAVADAGPESIDDRYALTAMQHGMLFQALYAPGSGVYVQQVAARLRGSLDAALFRRAWEALVDRHDVLRTAFDWEQGADPIQTVHHHAALPWTEEDWSGEDEDEQRQRLAQLLAADRGRGFDLRRPPLMRVFLARTGADAWQLVWTHHHLILDGWSVPLLLHDLFGAYRALLDGRQPVFQPRRPFRDHVAWIGARDGDAARAYWSAALRGLERPPALASSPAAGAAFAGSLHHVSHRLHEDATAALTAFARASGLTLSTVVQGAWAMVVAAYSNAREALYGVTVGGRPAALSGADRMVGLFINTLPVRVEPRPGARLVPWLRDLQQELARHRDFEHTPLVDILGWSPLGRRPGAIESLFVFENYPIDPAAAASVPGLTIEEADAHEQTDFALTVVAVPGRELLLKIDADAAAFALEDAERLLAALADTLEAFPDAADAPLGTVMPAAGVERWNQTARDWPDDRPIHELIDAQADRDPAAIAVRDTGRSLRFGELRDASSDVAAMLIGKGVGADHRVGVALPRSIELIVALVGVLKAGAAYVPLDPAQPDARRRALIDDAGIEVVIAAGDRWPAGARVALPRVSPDALAYVLYTSGSTGTPKGVMVTHRGLANYVRWAREAYAADTGGGALLHSPIGFDLTVTSLFPLLAAGRPVTIVSQDAGLDGLAAALVAGADYSLVKITPAHLDALRQLAPELRGATRAFVIGGDALTYDQLAHWRQAAPGTRLLNEYGPTETVVGCALHDATADLQDRGPVPIGAPIANTRLYVLDRALNAAPAGVTGELFIAGDGVARGYQGRPDLTAAAFLPDPFSPTAGARMYRSGDQARRRADGALEFLGRADDQLKIRGYRIEPGEIEAALLSEPAVREAAVVARAAANGERQLAAFVVTADAARDLRAYLRDRVPDHLVPATVTRVDRLPLTPNGKIDRALLARTPLAHEARDRAGDPPRGAAEELLTAIWSDVLQIDEIGRGDNFFDLGGHSLLATRIVARARLAFGGQLALRDIFDAPTIAGLAARIGRGGEGDRAVDAIEPRPAGEAPLLSFAQQRMWILEQLDPDGAAYLVPAALRLEGPLRVEAFRAALAAVVARHESLRTRVRAEEGAPVASVVASCQTPFTVVDLSDRPPADQASEVSRLAGIDARTPFDLARPPLLRATLLRLGDRHHVLLLAMHHLVSDAWSVDLLVQEIAAAYATPDAGAALPPPLPVQYADIARWQRRKLEGPALDRLVTAMTAKLAGVPVLELPADRPRPPFSSPRGSSVTVSLPAGAAALVTTARAENASPFMAFLAAFEVLLARYSGQRDFAVGTPVSGRDRLESERLIGLFMNTLVLRSDVGPRSTFVDVLRGVRGTLLQAQAHQELPFDRLVDALQPERALGHNPLFQVMFTLQHAPAPLDVAGLRVTPIDGGSATAKFDLSLSVNQTSSGWQATFEYRTDLFDEPTIAAMAHLYGRIVEEAARQPRSEVFRLPWLDAIERQAVIATGNDTRHGDGDAPDVWQAIAQQAGRTPDATAVMFEHETLTYAEIMRRVDARASALRADGVGPESIVPLSLERSIDLVISMLAVLAAGAAYAPLDPAAPPERLTAMLATIKPSESSCQTVSDSIWHGDALAYVIFTSGSTGTPKGVGIPRRALANHMRWMQRAFPLSPADRVLQKTPAIFDASVWEFFAPLMAGATLVVAAPGAHQDPDALLAAVERHQITTLQVVPSMLRLLVDEGRLRRCRSLRRVFAGGEALTRDLQDRFFAASSAELVNLYGPTEVTIDSVVWRCERGDLRERVPIGLPIDNTTAHVLDDRLEPVPPGVAGELYLGGASVARGYIGQPSLTADRFVPDPFSSTPGAVCYRTGDVVRRRADGVLEYLGRADQQIKLRGFRIELGEIERALESYPAVLQAAVLVDETPSRRRLVGYTVARDGQRVDADALRAHLAARLPDYMIPAAFVVLERLPLLPSGKLDRRALPAPPDALGTAGGAAPRDAREQILAGIWSAVLGIPAPGIRDNFFSLGGDSILALQVVARARKAGLLVTPAQLFVHQTIETLAAAAATTSGDRPSSPDMPDDETGSLPLTPVQRWFFELPLEDRHHWNQAMLLTTPPDLDRAALEHAIDDLIARHDALRLRFVADGHSWRQEYGTPGSAFEAIDLSGEADPAVALARDVDRIQRSLVLDAAPLLRVVWFDYGARPGRLLIVAHHLVVDGVSWRILLDDLQESYESRRSTAVAHGFSAATSFRAWTRQLDEVARSSELGGELAYWRAQLEPSPAPLPLDGDATDANLEADARHVEIELSEAQTDALLHALPAAMHTQVMDVLLAALADALAPWTGSRILTVELEAHGRDAFDLDVSQTVGWFTALFPLRLDTRGTTTPDRLLRAVRDQLRAVPRKGAGFGVLRYSGADGPGRASLAAQPPPSISFNYLGQWPSAPRHDTADATAGFGPAPEDVGRTRSARSPRTHILEIVAGVVDHRLRMRWTYGDRLHARDTIAALADAYVGALDAIAAHCLGAGGASYTPSDFTAADLDQSELDKLLSKLRGS